MMIKSAILITVSAFFSVSAVTAQVNGPLGAPPQEPATRGSLPPFSKVVLSRGYWNMPKGDIVAILGGLGFYWISKNQDEGRSTSSDLKFEDLLAKEVLLKFKGDRASEVRISLYNRADSDKISESVFKGYIKQLSDAFDRISQVKSSNPPLLTIDNHVMGKILWRGSFTNYRIEYGYNKGATFDPQFITVILTKGGSVQEDQNAKKAAKDPAYRDKVRSGENGDVWLDLPMVHQGYTEAYCGPAAIERIMRYYGFDLDKYQIAEFSNSSKGTSGTDPKMLFQGVSSLGAIVDVKPVMIRDWQYNDFRKVCDNYNEAALKQAAKKVSVPFGDIDIMTVYRKMDKQIFLSSQNITSAELNDFVKTIAKRIDHGIPIVWGVVSGMVEEIPPAPEGIYGHFRLIVGFNLKTSEILYTDTWGEGHELKRMNIRKADAITLCMFSIE